MSESSITTDQETIKKWVTERGGVPATVKEPEEDWHAGILRIDFPPRHGGLKEISWDEFFQEI
jgi:hypothetical protein